MVARGYEISVLTLEKYFTSDLVKNKFTTLDQGELSCPRTAL